MRQLDVTVETILCMLYRYYGSAWFRAILTVLSMSADNNRSVKIRSLFNGTIIKIIAVLQCESHQYCDTVCSEYCIPSINFIRGEILNEILCRLPIKELILTIAIHEILRYKNNINYIYIIYNNQINIYIYIWTFSWIIDSFGENR